MAGKKKTAKKVAKKAGKKRVTKVASLMNAQMKREQAERDREAQEMEADLKANPYVYKVIAFFDRVVYPIDAFKNLEAAQNCVDANAQINTVPVSIVVEKRALNTFGSAFAYDAW